MVKELSCTESSSGTDKMSSTVKELLSQINQLQAARSSASLSDENLTAHLSKLSKRKKIALLFMDKLVLRRISDYFSHWKLNLLLSKAQHSLTNFDQSLTQAECSLDYSVFRKYLLEQDK